MIPMPPAGCFWCLNPFLCILLLLPVFVIHFLFSLVNELEGFTVWVSYSIILVLSAIVARLLVAALVRFSIYHGECVVASAIEKKRPDLVVAFSWGGGVRVGVGFGVGVSVARQR